MIKHTTAQIEAYYKRLKRIDKPEHIICFLNDQLDALRILKNAYRNNRGHNGQCPLCESLNKYNYVNAARFKCKVCIWSLKADNIRAKRAHCIVAWEDMCPKAPTLPSFRMASSVRTHPTLCTRLTYLEEQENILKKVIHRIQKTTYEIK